MIQKVDLKACKRYCEDFKFGRIKLVPCRYGFNGPLGVISFNLDLITREDIYDMIVELVRYPRSLLDSHIEIILDGMKKLGLLDTGERMILESVINSMVYSVDKTQDFDDYFLYKKLGEWVKKFYIAYCFPEKDGIPILTRLKDVSGYVFTGERWRGDGLPLLTLDETIYKAFDIGSEYSFEYIDIVLNRLCFLCDTKRKLSHTILLKFFDIEKLTEKKWVSRQLRNVVVGYKIINTKIS